MIPSVNNAQAVAQHLDVLRKPGVPPVVAVDGALSAGKTRLAYCLSCQSDFRVLDTDQFLVAPGTPYVEHLDQRRLAELIESYRTASQAVLVAGIQVLALLARLNVTPDGLVYVMRLNHKGIWLDADECDHRGGSEQGLRDSISGISSSLARETAQYHLDFWPLDKATVIYQRTRE